tara:strand:+ start:386 stop:712 length:327 start_codon:yes stop_codon:yes gene_type:complete
MGLLQDFNINELAGATGLMLGALGTMLAIIFKSRCYCKFRLGLTDNCNICMCERKPPPDPIGEQEEETDEEAIIPPPKVPTDTPAPTPRPDVASAPPSAPPPSAVSNP